MNISILKTAIEFAKMNGKNLDIQALGIHIYIEKLHEEIIHYVVNDNLFNIEFLLLTGEIITIQYNEKLEFVNILSTFVNNNEVIDEIDNYIFQQFEHLSLNENFNDVSQGVYNSLVSFQDFIQTLK